MFRRGSLTIVAPNGEARRIGSGEPFMTVRVVESRFLFRMILDPELALGEAYMAGALTLEGGDIFDLLNLCYANIGFSTDLGIMRLGTMWRKMNRKATRSARASVSHHYDLSEVLYAGFLDSDRQYSCAYFLRSDDTLEIAQDRKKQHIAAKLVLLPGMRVVDLGSGWGGLAKYLARIADVHVTGVTLSVEQYHYAVRHADDAESVAQVRYVLEDYRKHTGRYDRVVSVGMLEHVGLEQFDDFFKKIRELLEDGGVALIHTIGRADGPGLPNPWIEKYIFPGGFLPALSEILPSIERAGLYVTDIEVLRLHYAYTLKEWRTRFNANRQHIGKVYDETFCRMWEFYLAASEASFRRHGGLVNFQIQLSNRVDALPLTRDYMVDWERDNEGKRCHTRLP